MLLRLTAGMEAALPLITTLRLNGFEAVFVGGAVRDAALGLPVQDIDIATSAKPEQIMLLFPKCIPTGLQHGTVTVMHNGIPYEMTTYRVEAPYNDHRKPQKVHFIQQLDEDLKRRDFTMNAMAIREGGELYDPFGGLTDLSRSFLRCVGNADHRFQEDALRMLRAVRFLGVYALQPAPSLWRSLKRHGSLLRFVAMERVQAELDKMMASQSPVRAFVWLGASGLLAHLKEPLPVELLRKLDLSQGLSQYGKWPDLDAMRQKDERWAAMLISMPISEQNAVLLLSSLRFSSKRKTFIVSIIQLQRTMRSARETGDADVIFRAWMEGVLQFGTAYAAHWLMVAQTLDPARGSITKEQAAELRNAIEAMPVKSLKELAVTGHDLQEVFCRPAGPWLSAMLKRLLHAAAVKLVANQKDKLLAQAMIWNEEDNKHESI